MTESDHGYKLGREIIALSEADHWDLARLEWGIEDIYMQQEPEACLCGHFPINELCVLWNRKNGNRAIVGNVCVRKFMKLPSNKMFAAIKRVTADATKAFNVELIEHAFAKGWINQWERGFYLDTWRKQNSQIGRWPRDFRSTKRFWLRCELIGDRSAVGRQGQRDDRGAAGGRALLRRGR